MDQPVLVLQDMPIAALLRIAELGSARDYVIHASGERGCGRNEETEAADFLNASHATEQLSALAFSSVSSWIRRRVNRFLP